MKKLLRSIARHKMQVEGVRRINKPRRDLKTGGKMPSYFAENWRKYVNIEKGSYKTNL